MSTTKTKVLICPYCGDTQAAGERCRVCGGLFEPLSRQASHNAMGPWFVRDERRPFQPGASYETIVKLIERGQITKYSILRCPTTKQFWTVARRVPGIAHLLGYCHNCDATVNKEDHGCPGCGVPFGAYLDRNYLGLPEVKPLPWEAPVIDEVRQRVAASLPTPMPSSMVDFRRAAEPLGLSSFASDDELRGMASRPAQSYGASGADSMHAQANGVDPHERAEVSTSAFASSSADEARRDSSSATSGQVDIIAARSMQRRLQRQRQTIRMLMVAMGVVSVVSVIVIIAMLLQLGRGDAANARTQPPADASPKAAAASSHDAANLPSQGEQNPPAQPLDASTPSATMPVEELNSPPAEELDSLKADHERAVALMAESRKEDRPLKDRIRDAESAAELLKAIKKRASAADKPASLEDEIIEADRLVERLKLQEFFP